MIAKRPCLMDRAQTSRWTPQEIRVTDECEGCGFCLKQFECPAMQSQGEDQPIRIDHTLCSGCGVCEHVCPYGAIEAVPAE